MDRHVDKLRKLIALALIVGGFGLIPSQSNASAAARPGCASKYMVPEVISISEPTMASQAWVHTGTNKTVVLRVTLSDTGDLKSVKIDKSSGYAIYDNEAIRAARSGHYAPALNNCAPVAGEFLYVVDFAD